MTDITDQQRREAAASLREAVADARNSGCLLDAEVFSILGVDSGDLDGSSDPEDVMRLADLIDRPTCRVESAERWETAGCGRGVDYELSCGHAATLGECDELRFCPLCGAEVVDE